MAQSKLISAFLFLVFILSQQIQSIEGRHLLEEAQTKIGETETIKHGSVLHGDDKSNEEITSVSPPTVNVSQPAPPPYRGVDDFRPTTPGHSPGVGHSIQN
ncbi:hypothetical protein ACB092_02G194000 [Castanea dentata]